ncbi:hypothetical protein Tco_0223506 [Tanacetum coccineum]
MNSKTSVMPSARFQSTADGSKPKPMSTNHSTIQGVFSPIPTGKLFDSCTGHDDSEPTHVSNVDIPNIHECKQTLDLSAGKSQSMVAEKANISETSVTVDSNDEIAMMFEQHSSSLDPKCQR